MKVTNGEKWKQKLPTLKQCPIGTVFRIHDPRSEVLILTSRDEEPPPNPASHINRLLPAVELTTGKLFRCYENCQVIVYPNAEVVLHSGED